METLRENCIFTNVALTGDGDVWWEGMGPAPAHAIDWKGEDWTPRKGTPAAHPNARFTAPARQCPTIDPAWEDPQGVPVEAIVFGGRLSKTFPLAFEANDFRHGVFAAATMGSEATAAAFHQATIRRDPFAMLPFCGYNMADHWRHWLSLEGRGVNLPRIFRVNWFRKDEEGRYLWPGYGQNLRVLKWIADRIRGRAGAAESAFGVVPRYQDLHWEGLDFGPEAFQRLMDICPREALAEAQEIRGFFESFGGRLPNEMEAQRRALEERARAAGAAG